MKYTVAEGASFVVGGVCFGPGSVIDSKLFSDDALKRALKTSERFPNGKLYANKATGFEQNTKKEEITETSHRGRPGRKSKETAEEPGRD